MMIHKFIIELTDDTKGYEDEVDYLERVYGVEELTDVPIIHGKAELSDHDKQIRDEVLLEIINKINNIGYLPVCVDCLTKHNLIEILEQMKGEQNG